MSIYKSAKYSLSAEHDKENIKEKMITNYFSRKNWDQG